MEQLSMVKNDSMFGKFDTKTETHKLQSAYYEFLDKHFGDVAVPFILNNRNETKSGIILFKKKLEEVGVK